MRFGIVRPSIKTMLVEDYTDLKAAETAIGLDGVDHGVINIDLGIVVQEFSIYKQGLAYFSIHQHLYAGNAVLYGFGQDGNTIDFERAPPIMWFDDVKAVELAIERRLIARPMGAVNGKVYWRWPEQRPSDKTMQEAINKLFASDQ